MESLHAVEKEFRSVTAQVLKTLQVSSSSELNHATIMKSNKDVIAKCLSSVFSLLEKNMDMCKSAAAGCDRLKSEQIEAQKNIIKIQQAQIGSVQESVKKEMKSWAEVASKNCQKNSLSVKTVEQAVRTVTAEEERAKNFIIFGLEEDTDGTKEDVISTMDKVFKELDYEEPYPEIEDSYRLGQKTVGVKRPVKVTLRSADLVQYLLKRAYLLKKSTGKFSKLYLAPDRSKQERLAHQKLVTEMKEMIKRDPSKHYFIRNNQIKFSDKNSTLE